MTLSRHRRLASLAMLAAYFTPRLAWSAQQTNLEIGVLPNISARVLMSQYKPVREYLERRTGRAMQVSTAPSWGAFHERTMGLEYDLVVTASHLARVAQLERGYIPLVMYDPPIKGMIACTKSRPLRSIQDIKGEILALSNPQSLVTLRGFQWLEDQGFQRNKHFTTINTPTDDSVGNVVLHGDARAAMLSGGEFRAIPSAIKEQLQIFTTFAEVPGFVVLANPRLPTSMIDALKQAYLELSARMPEGEAFFAASGFTSIRELPQGLMASMDLFLDATKKSMSTAR